MDNNDRKPGGKSSDGTVALPAHHQQKATDKGRKSNDPLPPLPDHEPFLTVNLSLKTSSSNRVVVAKRADSTFPCELCFTAPHRKVRRVLSARFSASRLPERHLTSVTLHSFRVFLSSGLEISALALLKRDAGVLLGGLFNSFFHRCLI